MSDQPKTFTLAEATTRPLTSAPVLKPTTLTGQMEQVDVVWTSDDEKLVYGLWECEPGTFTSFRDGYHETATILAGSATITADDGTVIEAKPGTMLSTPAGWKGTWVCHEKIRKVFNLIYL
jgi:uncharacterized cupin superfamily protein